MGVIIENESILNDSYACASCEVVSLKKKFVLAVRRTFYYRIPNPAVKNESRFRYLFQKHKIKGDLDMIQMLPIHSHSWPDETLISLLYYLFYHHTSMLCL